ncbi:sensor domain-containing diguanylate cyclase [Candidatus Accumulibacter aalborgensis]|uniref:sensor domain-containing diguanylate cyclase n=1 Tax=Candidatus Accumulibacter aalborgensis TaxID=1860102 RepID=UPI0016447BB2|nr:sensor domain-containing diguanylate cyclase [Candidatus Accumulibacter aalborgensis]
MDWPAEVTRLNKIIRVLMDRAERSTSVQGSDFSLFQTAIMLEEQVRQRTVELEAALRENERTNRSLRESEARFRAVVNQSLVGIVIIEDQQFSYTNARFNEIFGYEDDEIRALGPLDLVVESDRPLVTEHFRRRLNGEAGPVDYVFHGLRKDGAVRDIESHCRGMDIGGKLLLVSVVMDISERKRAEREVQALQQELREQSTHDALTGLYNRRYLQDTLGRELLEAKREGRPVSVILADLDHFKAVNDRHGHLGGDEALRVFGALLKRHARGSDIYCRYGGEEFLLVLPGMTAEIAVERAEQLRVAIASAPVNHGGSLISVTASFGIATFPRDGRNGDELIAAADRALYAAKAAGRNRVNVSVGATTSPAGQHGAGPG